MQVPAYVMDIIDRLAAIGHETFIVGGAVRDKLLGLVPQDWDLVTTASTEEICSSFDRVIPIGIRHGTVTVVSEDGVCEVSTMLEDSLEQDLGRRDFTINAIIFDPKHQIFIDPFDGRKDLLERKVVRGVNDPAARFKEDPVRLLRALRLRAYYQFEFDPETGNALAANAHRLAEVAVERIRDEFSALLIAPHIEAALGDLIDSGLMTVIIPELMEGQGMAQSHYHVFDVLDHGIKACTVIEPVLHLRLAALLHDVGKPPTRQICEERIRFDGHHRVGAERAQQILARLRYPNSFINQITHLIYHHMFYYTRETDDAGVRRIISTIGVENISDLLKIRQADFIAINPNRQSDYYANLTAHFNKVLAGPLLYTVHDLAIDGEFIKAACNLPEGPLIGEILKALLEKVQENPDLNNQPALLALAKQITGSC